jgi:hypothetical protein
VANKYIPNAIHMSVGLVCSFYIMHSVLSEEVYTCSRAATEIK